MADLVKDSTVFAFSEALASKAPTPGGGGGAAITAALAAALGSMAANLTIGKKKYAALEAELIQNRDGADALRLRLLALADADAEVFLPLSQAYSLPAETEEEKAYKADVMERALAAACEIPLEIMECCAQAIALIGWIAGHCSPLVVSDAAAAAAIGEGALKAASLNVYINAKSMADRDAAGRYTARADAILTAGGTDAAETFKTVKKQLCAPRE